MPLQNYFRILSYFCAIMKLLIVEDERELADNMRAYLSRGDVICEVAHTAAEAQDKLAAFDYDIVLLDLMLPDGSGLNVLRMLKDIRPESGVLIISAKNALDDKVQGLELGADDYLTKPFHLPELNARLNAIFRRRKFQGRKVIEVGNIKINTDTHDVTLGDQSIALTLKEYELLLFFITNKNRVLTKQTIAEDLWGDNVDFMDSFDFVYQHIKNLRKKLTASGEADSIKTIYGLGYEFSA